MGRTLVLLFVVVVVAGCSDSSPSIEVVALEPETTESFGPVRNDVTTTRTVTVQKPFIPGGAVELIEVSGPFTPAAGELPRVAKLGIDFPLKVVFDPALSGLTQLGSSAGYFRLRFTKSDGSLVMTSLVTLTAQVETPVGPTVTATVLFGGVAVDQLAVESVTVRNNNVATPIDVTGVSVGGAVFGVVPTVFPIRIPPGGSRAIPVSCQPPALGVYQATATVVSSIGGGQATTLRGTGIPSEVVTDLGFVAVDGGGQTPWVEFSVAPEAISIHLEIIGDDPSADFALNGFEGPDGTVYENDTFAGPYVWARNFPPAFGALFLQLPNSDEPALRLVEGGGTYRLRLLEFSPFNAGFHVRVTVEQRHRGRVSDGLLPLNVFLANGLPVSAATAAGDTDLQTVLGTMDALLAQRGLRLGAVSYFDITDPAYDEIDSFGEFLALQVESAAAPEDRLNLFFVGSLAMGGNFIGFAGAVPGLKRNGTPFSGVVIDYGASTSAIVGSTAAHEAGHYLGLFHTTQFDDFGNIVGIDLILDTEKCGLYEISPDCPTTGNDNLMWPYDLGFAEGRLLTLGQANVIKGHPLVEVGTMPAPPIFRMAQLAQARLPLDIPRDWCGNCSGLLPARMK